MPAMQDREGISDMTAELRDVSTEQLRQDLQALIEDRELIVAPEVAEMFDGMIERIRAEIEHREGQPI